MLADIPYAISACELSQMASEVDHHNVHSWSHFQSTGISECTLNQAMIQTITITWPAAKEAYNMWWQTLLTDAIFCNKDFDWKC